MKITVKTVDDINAFREMLNVASAKYTEDKKGQIFKIKTGEDETWAVSRDLTDASDMFQYCKAESIDLSSFDTSKVTNMSYMFEQCQAQSFRLSHKQASLTKHIKDKTKIVYVDADAETQTKVNSDLLNGTRKRADGLIACSTCFGTEDLAVKNDRIFDKAQIDRLVDALNSARDSYYNKSDEIMSNYDYDKEYDKLVEYERITGYIRPDSPTQNVGAPVASQEPVVNMGNVSNYTQYRQGDKVQHEIKALSLDKTKSVEDLKSLLQNMVGVLSIKLDGLTTILTYLNGSLVLAATRGDGAIGECVTTNAQVIKGIPQKISYAGLLIVRGEVTMTYKQFEAVNAALPAGAEPFKNPRNLAAGTLRTFNNLELVRSRGLRFTAFELANWGSVKGISTMIDSFEFLDRLGFTTVTCGRINHDTVEVDVQKITEIAKASGVPADGLVLRLNDLQYGDSLGMTGKFPRHSIAFKWEDALVQSTLRDIDWTVGRTGIITPTAVFDPIDLDGSTVQRASVHNISIVEQTLGMPYVGQRVWVYKSNMIIPQIEKAEKLEEVVGASQSTAAHVILKVPRTCPNCGGATEIRRDASSGVKTLWCTNTNCSAKATSRWKHFVSRECMNVEGLSEATLADMMDIGLIEDAFSELFTMKDADLVQLCNQKEGYGIKKIQNLRAAIEKARNTNLVRMIAAFGIKNVGLQTAKTIVKLAHDNVDELLDESIVKEIYTTNGLGAVVATQFGMFLRSNDRLDFEILASHVNIQPYIQTGSALEGMTFCCTGVVHIFPNRDALQELIESKGGKFTTSVTRKTTYLITNDTTSGSKKNRDAAALGIPIITEAEFINMFGN